MLRRGHALKAVALSLAILAVPAEAVQRAFVASFGNDANTATNCGFANPCRGFTAAHSVTDPNGEIVALDAAGYGPITITKSITITANPGFYAGISASSGDAVTIATAGVNVILRGLNINGIGATNGVLMTNGNRLSVENCVISNFSIGNAISVNGVATVRVVDSLIRENYEGVYLQNGANGTISGTKLLGHGAHGVFALGTTAATTTTVAVSDSLISGNGIAVEVGAQTGTTARATVTNSTLVNNVYGFAVDGNPGTQIGTISNSVVTGNQFGLDNFGGTLESLGNNNVRQNTMSDLSGTITVVPGN